MPRISNVVLDKNVEKGDKLLGSDAGGATKNYSIDDITIFLKDTNGIGIVGQIPYVLHNSSFGGYPTRQKGSLTISSSLTTFAFSSITTLKASKFPNKNDESVVNVLSKFAGKEVIIASNENQDNFGIYSCTAVTQDNTETDFYDLTLSFLSGNGNLVIDKFYSITLYAGTTSITTLEDGAVTTIKINDGAVTNDKLSGSIANSKLSNSSVIIGNSTIALGSTDTTLTGLTDIDLTAGAKTIFDGVGSNNLTIGASGTTIVIPGDLTVTGNVQLNSYGSGTITGTTAYNLAVDSSGNIIENSANTRSIFVATSTDTTTNINATTTIQWNSEDIKDSGYTHSSSTNPDQITITQAGTYKIYAAITYTTTTQRANVALQILVNDVATGARGAGGYVRSSSSHNDGTTIVEDYVTVSANDVIKIQTSQEAANGTVNLRSGESKIIIEKLTGLTLSITNANTLGGLSAADFARSDSVPAGNNTEIQFNNNGQLGASSNFTFDGTDLTVDGDVLINKTDSTQSILTVNTNRSFGRDFTITNNGQDPVISAGHNLTIEAQDGQAELLLHGGGNHDRVQIGKNGSYLFYFGLGGTYTGRLGIGTTSPSEKLEVNGKIKAVDVNFSGLSAFSSNADAIAGGLSTGDLYQDGNGVLRIVI